MSDFPTPDEIINGTYKPKTPEPQGAPMHALGPEAALEAAAAGKTCTGIVIQVPEGFVPNPDLIKAIGIVVSGLPFVLVGVQETFTGDDHENATGADFHTVLHGDKAALRNAGPELPGVIERLYGKHGIL